MQRGREKGGRCAYCGAAGTLTKDHVPPKCLFLEPLPSNLITVPACPRYHSVQTSLDDEYFRLALIVREDLSNHPDVVKAQPEVMRKLFKPRKTGMLESFLKNVRPIELATPGGLFIKRSLGFQTDMVRLRRVVQRVLKGLFYHVKGYRIPDGYEALVLTDDNIEKWPKELVNPVMSNRAVTLGNGVFSYRAAFHKDNHNVSGWMFVFYERASFLGVTLRAWESGAAPTA